jgi:hypothetical protein
MKPRPLFVVAFVLLGVAVVGMVVASPDNQLPALVAWLAIVILCELPAVFWRTRGGTAYHVWAAAVFSPLILFETLMGISAYANRDIGGDLQGIEGALMLYVILPGALVTGTVVAVFVCLAVRPEEKDGY